VLVLLSLMKECGRSLEWGRMVDVNAGGKEVVWFVVTVVFHTMRATADRSNFE